MSEQKWQAGLLRFYSACAGTGALNTPWGRVLFERVYTLYKTYFEAPAIGTLQSWVRPTTWVIDVGANIGVFTLHFAHWVSNGGRVLAFEPEPANFARLQHAIQRSGVQQVVEAIQAAVGDSSGEALLEVNPVHPGDHKLGHTGIPVPLTSIDDALGARGWPEISLIKIDVQGAEMLVLSGATESLARFRPVLYIEVDDNGLKRYGSSVQALLSRFADQHYTFHTIKKRRVSPPLSAAHIESLVKAKGYIDVLLLPAKVVR